MFIRGMNDNTCRFVDDEQVVILEDDRDVNGLHDESIGVIVLVVKRCTWYPQGVPLHFGVVERAM